MSDEHMRHCQHRPVFLVIGYGDLLVSGCITSRHTSVHRLEGRPINFVSSENKGKRVWWKSFWSRTLAPRTHCVSKRMRCECNRMPGPSIVVSLVMGARKDDFATK